MRGFLSVAALAAGLVALFASGADAALSLTSFGAAQRISSYAVATPEAGQFSATRIVGTDGEIAGAQSSRPLFAAPAFGPLADFAASAALTSTLALDAGQGADVAARFDDSSGLYSPLISPLAMRTLAAGGAYMGATWLPTSDVRVRFGGSATPDEDRTSTAPASSSASIPGMTADGGARDRALFAGVSWDFARWGNLGFTASQTSQFGLDRSAGVATPGRVEDSTLGVWAHIGLGAGWEASYSESLSQLDLRPNLTVATLNDVNAHSYSIAIAKHGLFGDDALGLSFSRPMPSPFDNGFTALAGAGDLPPVFLAPGQFANSRTPETDIQLGYVTTFLGGALALQTNAAYEMNVQGQSGTNAVSLLSRARIKF